MARYFFHVTHGADIDHDRDGVDLVNRAAAWEQATQACSEMMAEIDGDLAIGTDWRMVVDDEDGPLFVVHFGADKLR